MGDRTDRTLVRANSEEATKLVDDSIEHKVLVSTPQGYQGTVTWKTKVYHFGPKTREDLVQFLIENPTHLNALMWALIEKLDEKVKANEAELQVLKAK
jgi:hypothetical protein